MIALAVLAVAVIVFAVREIRLYGDVQVEQSRTPTPVPGYGNVMQVTIDPSLPTPVPVLRSGAQGEAVWQLQERLQALGYLTGSAVPAPAWTDGGRHRRGRYARAALF